MARFLSELCEPSSTRLPLTFWPDNWNRSHCRFSYVSSCLCCSRSRRTLDL